MKKRIKLSKDELIEGMFGIPVGTTDTWFEEQLKRERIKWNKGEIIMKQYKLGEGDLLRKNNGQMTKEYIEQQSTQLLDVDRSNESKSRGYDNTFVSDYRDYFDWIEDKNDTNYYKDGEWKWNIDGKEKYNLLVELNKRL